MLNKISIICRLILKEKHCIWQINEYNQWNVFIKNKY